MAFITAHRRSRRIMPSVAVVALVTLFAPFVAFQPAVAAEGDPDEPVYVQFEKEAIPAAADSAVVPGGTVTYPRPTASTSRSTMSCPSRSSCRP